MPEDLDELAAVIRKAGDAMFLADRTPGPAPRQLDDIRLPPELMGEVALKVYVCLRHRVDEVVLRHVEPMSHWVIEGARSPVLELSRCYFDGELLRLGRIYMASDRRFRPQPADPGLLQWSDRAIRAVRRAFPRDPGVHPSAYVSSRVRAWAAETGARPTAEGLRVP